MIESPDQSNLREKELILSYRGRQSLVVGKTWQQGRESKLARAGNWLVALQPY